MIPHACALAMAVLIVLSRWILPLDPRDECYPPKWGTYVWLFCNTYIWVFGLCTLGSQFARWFADFLHG